MTYALRICAFHLEIPNLRTRRALWAIGWLLDINEAAAFSVDLKEKLLEGNVGLYSDVVQMLIST